MTTQGQEHALLHHQNIGDMFAGVYYVENAFVKQTVHQKDYLDLTLRDKSGSRSVKYWGVLAGLKKGDWLFISANVEEYQGRPSIVAKNIEKADEPADMSDYIPVYDDGMDNRVEFENLRGQLRELEKKGGDGTAGLLVDQVFGNQSFFNGFMVAPGSDKPHYGRQGGMLAATVRLCMAVLSTPDYVRLTDYEKVVLLASAFLCRVGAIDSYEFLDCMPVMTDKGMLLGINNLTMTRVSTALKRVILALKKGSKAPDQDIVLRILHAVTSHDGNAMKPMTKEAIILNAAYQSDVAVVSAMDFIDNDANEGDAFTAYDPVGGRKYYTG